MEIAQAIAAIYALLPGFVAAMVAGQLTERPRKRAFNQVVEALVLTFLVQSLALPVVKLILLGVGTFFVFGEYTKETELWWSGLLGLAAGVLIAIAINHDLPHRWLRKWKITSKSALPTQWFFVLKKHDCGWVQLYLRSGQEIIGYATDWPDRCTDGHFCLARAAWVVPGKDPQNLGEKNAILIPAKDVQYVTLLDYQQDEPAVQAVSTCVETMILAPDCTIVERRSDAHES